MLSTRTRLLSLAALGASMAIAGTASATTISSFTTGATFYGITITPTTTPSPSGSLTSYTVTLNAGAYVTIAGNDYTILDITGFYALAFGFNDNPQTGLSTSGLFNVDSDHRAAGSVFGWKSQTPNDGITVGNSHTFPFPDMDSHYTAFGMHIRIDGLFPGTDGNTGNVTGGFSNLTPTPGSAALFGIGGLAAARRRRV